MQLYFECDNDNETLEILINHHELKRIINSLIQFDEQIEHFKTIDIGKRERGYTHIHLKDSEVILNNHKQDIVLYVKI